MNIMLQIHCIHERVGMQKAKVNQALLPLVVEGGGSFLKYGFDDITVSGWYDNASKSIMITETADHIAIRENYDLDSSSGASFSGQESHNVF
jgi:hypothetical protein